MSHRLENAAEILKFGRLIGLRVDDLTCLQSVPAAEIRLLRERVTDSLFDEAGQAFGRIGAAAKLLPSAVAATIAERYFGPLLCARAAAAVEPAKAIDIASRLSASFLADTTIELDPRRVADIIAHVPSSLVGPVAAELGKRGEYVTMGRFLAFVPDHAIATAMASLSDEAMLRTAFVLEHKDALDHAIGVLPPDRMPGILKCASEQDLWSEALDLLDHLSQKTRAPIADVMASLDEELVSRLVSAVSRMHLWETLLPVVALMNPAARVLIASRTAFHEPAVLAEIIDAAAYAGAWGDLLPLIEALPAVTQAQAADLLSHRPGPDITALVAAAQQLGLWHTLLPVVDVMQPQARQALVAHEAFHRPAVLRDIIEAATASGLWPALVPLISSLPPDVGIQCAQIIATLEPAVLTAAITQAVATPETLEPLLELITHMEISERASVLALIENTPVEVNQQLLLAAESPAVRRLLADPANADVAAVLDRVKS